MRMVDLRPTPECGPFPYRREVQFGDGETWGIRTLLGGLVDHFYQGGLLRWHVTLYPQRRDTMRVRTWPGPDQHTVAAHSQPVPEWLVAAWDANEPVEPLLDWLIENGTPEVAAAVQECVAACLAP